MKFSAILREHETNWQPTRTRSIVKLLDTASGSLVTNAQLQKRCSSRDSHVTRFDENQCMLEHRQRDAV
jgi:hypothetical protein